MPRTLSTHLRPGRLVFAVHCVLPLHAASHRPGEPSVAAPPTESWSVARARRSRIYPARRSPTKRPQVRPPSAHSIACCLHPGRVPRLATHVTPLVAQARPLAPCRSHSPPAHSLIRSVSAGVSDAESALVAGAWSPPHVPPPRAPVVVAPSCGGGCVRSPEACEGCQAPLGWRGMARWAQAG